MDQPLENDTAASHPASTPGKKKKKKLPSPRELVSHYEAQGMDTQEASLKVIEDLQNALFRMMLSSSSGSRAAPTATGLSSENSRKLDVINARLVQLEMKVDSKPGYPQSLAIVVASGALLGSAAQIWNAVRRATGSSTDH